MRTTLKSLISGNVIDKTFRAGEKVDKPDLEEKEMQYLYREGDHFVFMNTETFEQLFIDEKLLGNKKDFLKDGTVVSILLMGDKPIDITPPTFVELKVVESGVSTKTGTVTPQMKSAVMETGYTIAVPAFVKEGDIIKVDTRTGEYLERVS